MKYTTCIHYLKLLGNHECRLCFGSLDMRFLLIKLQIFNFLRVKCFKTSDFKQRIHYPKW